MKSAETGTMGEGGHNVEGGGAEAEAGARGASLAAFVKSEALALGFSAVGIAPAVPLPGYARFREWLEKGHGAGMEYLHRHAEARAHPDSVLDSVRSIVVCVASYNGPSEDLPGPTYGKVARYARGRVDYHRVLWDRLEALLRRVQGVVSGVRGRAVVDTAPLLERDVARLAGLGWIGKNTMLIHKRHGSFTFLGGLLVDVELEYDAPFEADHCGTCRRCLDACPTEAFVGPYELDSRRCISYWTIEHRGAIPAEIAGRLDGWAFGCDICQDVCPWNRKASLASMADFQAGRDASSIELIGLLEADASELARLIRGSSLSRAKRGGLVRNAALILGARGVMEARAALEKLVEDSDIGVRSAATWALARLSEGSNGNAPGGRGVGG